MDHYEALGSVDRRRFRDSGRARYVIDLEDLLAQRYGVQPWGQAHVDQLERVWSQAEGIALSVHRQADLHGLVALVNYR
ncbi:hypothetical protein DDW04_00355 [Sulfolobales archaeon SCGC AB-777_K09]|nr:hypothetical protein DDW04_00355 [Sulfolobales archaeon SCGC AB-777_K09]